MTPVTRLRVLGEVATLSAPDRPSRSLERKVAGMLAYLALEGATARTVLAGLLWPDTPETTARSNLRQTIRRLHGPDGAAVVQGEPLLTLLNVQADVAELEVAAFAGQDAQVVALADELLGTYDYADCPDFLDWLLAQRERLLTLRLEAFARLAQTAEARGDLQAALAHAQRLLALDPLSEAAHRLVMRLHAVSGDRSAALLAFEHCQATLKRELNVLPLPETAELARQIQDGAALPAPQAEARLPLPQAIQRPPILVGREREWRELEAAWQRGQTLIVSGPAGVGKTRLLRDFLASKGPYEFFQAQPAGGGVPYASLTLLYRYLLQRYPQVALPDWVRAELARLLPELGPPAAPSGAAPGGDELRFLEAQVQFLVQLAGTGLRHLMLDNMHLADQASFASGYYLHAHPALRRAGIRMALSFRDGELPEGREQVLQQSAEGGSIGLLHLMPLKETDVQALLDSLALPLAPGAAGTLTQHTGGNPLFILEILRSLLETGPLGRSLPEHLPVPSSLGTLVTRRLERLSLEARSLARTAAVAGADFSLPLAAEVMDTTPLLLAEPWAELRGAHLLEDQGFTHGLLEEITLQGVPAAILAWLHRRVALYLEGTGADPSAIARHWSAAAEDRQAAPWWLKAAQVYQGRQAIQEAETAFVRVLDAARPGEEIHLDALYGLGVTLSGVNPAAAEAHLLALCSDAQAGGDPGREAQAHAALANLYRLCGRLAEGQTEVTQALKLLPPHAPAARAGLLRTRFWLELRCGHPHEAEQAIAQAMELTPNPFWLENERALLYWHTGRFQDAARMYEQLLAQARERHESEQTMIGVAANMSWTYWTLSRNREAVNLLEQALRFPASPFDRGVQYLNLGTVLCSLGQYARSMQVLAQAQELLAKYDLHLVDALHRQGLTCYRADQHALALPYLQQAADLGRRVGDPYRLSYTVATLAAVEANLGQLEVARAHATEALTTARRTHFPLSEVISLHGSTVMERLSGHPQAALERALEAAQISRRGDMWESVGQSLLLAGLVPGPDAETHLQEALSIGQQRGLPDVVWRSAQALSATDPSMAELACQTRETLRHHSPPGWLAELAEQTA